MLREARYSVLFAATLAVLSSGCGPRYRMHKDLVYDTTHGVSGTFDEYVPPGKGHVRPALIYIHGGAWQGGDKAEADAWAPQIADRGYVVLSINYRLAPKDPWPAQLDDCQAAVRYFRANAAALDVDPQRIGVFGGSAGGHLASMTALVDDPKVSPGPSHVPVFCSVAGESDLTNPNGQSDEVANMTALFGARPPWSDTLLKSASPVFHARKDVAALLIHGEFDPNVNVNQSDELNAALTATGAQVWYLRRHSAEHAGALRDDRVLDALIGFFDSHL
jgi:acetyl esterase/lipase